MPKLKDVTTGQEYLVENEEAMPTFLLATADGQLLVPAEGQSAEEAREEAAKSGVALKFHVVEEGEVEHVVTGADLAANPELKEVLSVGDTIVLPPESEEVVEEVKPLATKISDVE